MEENIKENKMGVMPVKKLVIDMSLPIMISMLVQALYNVVDSIFVSMLGEAGAAIATVLGQCVAACIGLYLNVHYNTELHFSLKRVMRPAGAIIAEIYAIGIPSILMMAIGSVMTYCMDLILIAFSSTATAVFGVYFKLQSFFFMPIFGLNNGLIPMLAYNFGARKRKRIDETFAFAFKLAVVIMLIGTAVFEIFPEKLLQMFNASDDMLRIGVPALRIIAIHFVIAAVDIVMGGGFQAFAMSIYSFFISLGRQLVVLIPVAWLLAKTGNVNNVWWCFLIAEFASFLMSTTFFRKLYRERIKPLAA